MRVAGGRANKVLAFCVVAMVAILLELLLAVNPAHAATFTVTNTTASGDGSLDQAITNANNNNNAPTIDTIKFTSPTPTPAATPGCARSARPRRYRISPPR